jgi:hypothetical protein
MLQGFLIAPIVDPNWGGLAYHVISINGTLGDAIHVDIMTEVQAVAPA